MKTIINTLIVLCVAVIAYKLGLPAYSNYQISKLDKAYDQMVASYDAADPGQQAVLQSQWLALLDKRIENTSVTSADIRKALGELNKDAGKHEVRLLHYLNTLDLARDLDENIQYAQLLYKQSKHQLNPELESVIEKILTEKPRDPATLLILTEQSLFDGDRELVKRALAVIMPQLSEKGHLRTWANKLQSDYDSAED